MSSKCFDVTPLSHSSEGSRFRNGLNPTMAAFDVSETMSLGIFSIKNISPYSRGTG